MLFVVQLLWHVRLWQPLGLWHIRLLCLPEITQIHIHWVGDVIKTSHALLAPSSFAFSLFQQLVFSNESALHITWPKYWSFSFRKTLAQLLPQKIGFLFFLGSSLVSSSLLELSTFLLIVFLNFFRIFISFFLNSESNRLKKSVSSFFQGIALDLLIRSGFCASSFCLYFSYSRNLRERVIYCGLARLFLYGSVPMSIVWV